MLIKAEADVVWGQGTKTILKGGEFKGRFKETPSLSHSLGYSLMNRSAHYYTVIVIVKERKLVLIKVKGGRVWCKVRGSNELTNLKT